MIETEECNGFDTEYDSIIWTKLTQRDYQYPSRRWRNTSEFV